MNLYEELRALVSALEAAEIDYAVCGAIALAIHGVPRATRDIDVLVRAADLDSLRAVAKQCGFTIEALPMTFASSGITVHRFSKLGPGQPLMLDVLLAEPPLDAVFEDRISVPYEDGAISVVSRQGLVTLKLAAARPQDLADVQRLEELGDD